MNQQWNPVRLKKNILTERDIIAFKLDNVYNMVQRAIFKSNISLRQNVAGFCRIQNVAGFKNLQHCCPNFFGVGAWYTPTIDF